MEDEVSSQNIVDMIVQLSRKFGLQTVAEGVESNATLCRLIRMRCSQVQGYLFARPMSQPNFLKWLKNYHDAYSKDQRLSAGSVGCQAQ